MTALKSRQVVATFRLAVTSSLQLGALSTSGDVSISASTITDAGTGASDTVNISADEVYLATTSTAIGVGVGSGSNHLELNATKLAASVSGQGGLYITESDGLHVGTLNAINVKNVANDGLSTVSTSDSAQSSISSAGNLVIVTNVGTIETLATGGAITAAGNILLDANGNLMLGAAVSSTGGNISMVSGGNFEQSAVMVSAANAGTIDVRVSGTMTMTDGAEITSGSGNIRLVVTSSLQLGALSTSDDVSISASTITDAGLSTSDTVNISADEVYLSSTSNANGAGVGTGSNHLELNATKLAASVSGQGSMYITESDGLQVGALTAINVKKVASDGSSTVSTSDSAQSNISSDSTVVIVTNAGNIETLAAGGTLTAAGNILLDANGNLMLGAAVSSTGGNISMVSGGNFEQSAVMVSAANAGTIDVRVSGTMTMTDGAEIKSGSGNIRLAVTSSLQLGAISTSGDVSISASTITDAGTGASDTVNISADEVYLATTSTAVGAGIGSGSNHIELNANKLAADVNGTGTGGMYITESDGLQVGALTAINVKKVASDGSSTASTSDTAQSNISSDGNFVIVTNAGNIETLAAGGTLTAAGNILLDANGNLTLGTAVSSTGGNISLVSGGNFEQSAVMVSATGSGTIDVRVSGSMTMVDGAEITSVSGNIRLTVTNGLQLGALSTSGDVSISASTITDAGTGVSDTVNISADEVYLSSTSSVNGAGIGTGSNHIELNASKLAASVSGQGGMYITESDGLQIGTLDAINVKKVSSDGLSTVSTADTAQSNISSAGNLVIVITVGNIETLAVGGTLTAAGNMLLDAKANLMLGAAVSSTAGNVSMVVSGSMSQSAVGDVSAAGAGTVDVRVSGTMTMIDGAEIKSGSGNIRLAVTSSLQLGVLSTSGDVSISASTITDAGAGASDTVNISADKVYLSSTSSANGAGIGTGSNHLELNANKLAADVNGTGTGGLFITESDGLQVGALTAINVKKVANDGSSTVSTADAAQSNISSDSNVVIVTNVGTIEMLAVGGTLTAAGNILLDANGSSSDVVIGADIKTPTGHITIKADDSIELASDVDITTATAGTISVDAEGGTLRMAGNSTISAVGSSMRLAATGTVTVGNTTAEFVSIVSRRGAIINAAGSTRNVTASDLRLQSYGSIGSANRHFTTQVVNLSIDPEEEGAGIYLEELDDVVVTTVRVDVTEMTSVADTLGISDQSMADLVTSSNGTIVLVTIDGSITLTDGDHNGVSISADGTGNVHLEANGADNNVIIEAAIQTDTGSITIVAAGDVEQQANIVTNGNLVSVQAEQGSITMDQNVQTITNNGTIEYRSYEDVLLSLLHAESGSVAVYAETGSIENNTTSNTAPNVTSETALFKAGADVGLREIQPVVISVERVAAEAVTGEMSLVNLGTVVIDVLEDADGNMVSGLSAGDGISLESLQGSIVVAAPVDTKGTADALLTFSNGQLIGKSAYFDDAGTFLKMQYKQFQFLWNGEGATIRQELLNMVVGRQVDSDIARYRESASERQTVSPARSTMPMRSYDPMESLRHVDVDVLEEQPGYVEVHNGYAFFRWAEVPGAQSYLLVLERDKLEYASRWLEETAWAPFEELPEGIFEWSLYSWTTDGLQLVFGPMQFTV